MKAIVTVVGKDRVGIIGNVCAVKDKTIVIETGADRVRLEYAQWAVMNKGVAVDQNQQ